jgi:hypothetical protein
MATLLFHASTAVGFIPQNEAGLFPRKCPRGKDDMIERWSTHEVCL